jgi:toxin CcdB
MLLMSQFDVYQNPNSESGKIFPYLLDVQADLLENLPTRVVVPLVDASSLRKTAPVLNPLLTINGIDLVMLTTQMTGVSLNALGVRICSLKEHRHEILAALDFLFTGY